MKNYMQYILARTDIPDVSVGKIMAQAVHAGNLMTHDAKTVTKMQSRIANWEADGNGFGTCIVLEVTVRGMREAVRDAQSMGLLSNVVHDPSYPIWDGEKIQTIPLDTCAYVFGTYEECLPVVGRFGLLKRELV